ncbi:hypothetical protein [Gallaecimonas sp. GXIMD1310]|uniref:hypothetical protein n=1 Tax=Gallaecimonas sp. GXIMD1310 TaxID=3131926 RepID=UPI00324962DE
MTTGTIKSTTATLQVGVAKADGKLALTTDEVLFSPYNQQLGLGPYRFARSAINAVSKCLGKGGGLLPVTTDAIRVTLSNGQVYEFIVAEPEQWLTALAGPKG